MDRSVTLQDMLSHRTGMPTHDYSEIQRDGGLSEMVCLPFSNYLDSINFILDIHSTLPPTLRRVARNLPIQQPDVRDTILPPPSPPQPDIRVLHRQHNFKTPNMSASTFSVAEAEARGNLADGFQWDMQDIIKRENGALMPTVPYFQRPGEERTWAGAGGVPDICERFSTFI
jgi:hypothetical protein